MLIYLYSYNAPEVTLISFKSNSRVRTYSGQNHLYLYTTYLLPVRSVLVYESPILLYTNHNCLLYTLNKVKPSYNY